MLGSKRVIEILINAKENAGPAFDSLKGKVGDLIKNKALLATAAAAAGAAIAAMAIKSVKAYNQSIDAAGKYQEKILEVMTLTGGNSQEAAKLSGELQKLAVKYGQVDKVMAQAQYNIVSAGFGDVADSMTIMEVASKAAIGGVTDVNTAVKVITQTLNAYGQGAEKAEEIAGTLFATVKGGVTTFSELSANLGAVTGTAATAGISFEEVSAAMALMTKNGANTSESANALNALILALGAASGESKQKLNDLGINLDRGLGPALEGISKASEGSLEKLVELVPNIRAIKAAASTAKNEGRDFAEQLKAMANGAADFNSAYEIMASGYQQAADKNAAAQERLKKAFGSTGLEGKQKFLDAFTDGLSSLADVVEENSDGLKKFADIIGTVTGALIKVTAKTAGFVYWAGDKLSGALSGTVGDLAGFNEEVEKANSLLEDTTGETPYGDFDFRAEGSYTAEVIKQQEAITEEKEKAADKERERETQREQEKDEALEKKKERTKELNKLAAKPLEAAPDVRIRDAAAGEALTEEILLIEEIMAKEAERQEQLIGYSEAKGESLLLAEEAYRAEIDLIDEQIEAVANLQTEKEKLLEKAIEAGDAVARIGETTAQAFLRGENTMKAFGSAIKNEVINAISEAIAKMIRFKAISTFMKIFGGPAAGAMPMAHGGTILRAAAGLTVPIGARGLDSVPVMMQPEETVVDRSTTQQLKSFLAARESASMADPATLGTGGGGAVVSLNVARPVNHLDMLDMGRAAVIAGQQVAEANL